MRSFDKIKKFMAKYWITFWLVAALVTVIGFVAKARYNDGRNYAKRVVATQKGERQLFSSDFLNGSLPLHYRTVDPDESADQYFDVSVFNYDLKNPGPVYPIDIDYELSVEFFNGTGTTPLSAAQIAGFIGTEQVALYAYSGNSLSGTAFITVAQDTDEEDRTVSRTVLQASGADKFRLVLPISMKDKDISVRLTAAPSGYADLPAGISGLFTIRTQTFTKINGWSGDFNDDKNVALSDYDGFNYSIVGSGTAEGTLSWRNDLLELNSLQIDSLKMPGTSVVTSGTTSSITISLNSADNSGRYDLQFYVKNDDNGSGRSVIDAMQWSAFANKTTGAVTFAVNAS